MPCLLTILFENQNRGIRVRYSKGVGQLLLYEKILEEALSKDFVLLDAQTFSRAHLRELKLMC